MVKSKSDRKDFSQTALAVVVKAAGVKQLKPKKRPKRKA
jgi:hypothetical protein